MKTKREVKTDSPGKITLDRIKIANARPFSPCCLAAFLETRDPDEKATIYRAMEDPSISASAIASVLTERGWGYDRQVLWRHRTKGCRRCQSLGLKMP